MFDEQKQQAEIEKREAQLKEWNARIDKLSAQLQQADADAKKENLAELESRLNQLKAARDSASAELEQLRSAVESNWTDLMQKADAVFQVAAQKFHEFASKDS